MSESVCPHCGGTGWKIVEREGASGAERCDCQNVDRTRLMEERAGIPPLYRNASLDNFRLPTDNPIATRELGRVMNLVRTYTREFPTDKKPGLLLMGEPGTGKTHLAVAALRVLISRGFEGVFFDYQNLLHKIHSGYDQVSGASDRAAYRMALEAEVLLLDDLGTNVVTDWVRDTVTAIITERCNNRKPLISTTNLPDSEAGDSLIVRDLGSVQPVSYKRSLAEHVGERARSRLFEMCRVVRMPMVEDYRLRKIGKAN